MTRKYKESIEDLYAVHKNLTNKINRLAGFRDPEIQIVIDRCKDQRAYIHKVLREEFDILVDENLLWHFPKDEEAA